MQCLDIIFLKPKQMGTRKQVCKDSVGFGTKSQYRFKDWTGFLPWEEGEKLCFLLQNAPERWSVVWF